MHGMRWRDALEIIEEQKSQAYWSGMARDRLFEALDISNQMPGQWRDDLLVMVKYCQAQSRKAARNMLLIQDPYHTGEPFVNLKAG